MNARGTQPQGVLVWVRCGESGAYHERRGVTRFGPFRRADVGDWREWHSYGTRARLAAERRPPDSATDPETGAVDLSRLPMPGPGRNARPSDLNPGLRPRATRFVRRDGRLVSEQDEGRVEEAVRRGTRTSSAGRFPADAIDAEASEQLTLKCGCGLSRTMKADDAAKLFDRLVAAGEREISLRGLIYLHQRFGDGR